MRTVLILLAAACAGPSEAAEPLPRPDLEEERRALLAADAALSAAVAERGLLDALVPALAEDAYYLQPQQPLVRGREAVRGLLTARPASGALRYAWRAIRVDVSSDGRLGYTFGYGRYAPAGADGTPASGNGGYLIVWERDAADAWRVAGFVRNNAQANLAAAPPGFESPSYRQYVEFAPRPRDSVRADVARADVAFSALAVAEGPAVGFSTYAAPDGALLSGAFGPAAIRASLAGAPAQGGGWTPAHTVVAATADLGWTVGNAVAHAPGGATVASASKYITVWKRQRDGAWRYVIDGGNASPLP